MSVIDKNSGEKVYFTGYIQPLRYKNKMYLGETVTALEYDNSRKYLLIAPYDVDLSDADGYEKTISDEKDEYCCDRFEYVTRGGEAVYSWAVVTKNN